MKLKQKFDVLAFVRQAELCAGEVNVETGTGDRLNMKSVLGRMVFAVAVEKEGLLAGARVVCANADDYALLAEFVEE